MENLTLRSIIYLKAITWWINEYDTSKIKYVVQDPEMVLWHFVLRYHQQWNKISKFA